MYAHSLLRRAYFEICNNVDLFDYHDHHARLAVSDFKGVWCCHLKAEIWVFVDSELSQYCFICGNSANCLSSMGSWSARPSLDLDVMRSRSTLDRLSSHSVTRSQNKHHLNWWTVTMTSFMWLGEESVCVGGEGGGMKAEVYLLSRQCLHCFTCSKNQIPGRKQIIDCFHHKRTDLMKVLCVLELWSYQFKSQI